MIAMTVTCNDASLCGSTEYITGGSPTHSGRYLNRIDPVLVAGTYDVKIFMKNEYTVASPPRDAIVVEKHLTVKDTRTTPNSSTLESSPPNDTLEVTEMATFTMQSRSTDRVPQPEDGDDYTVTVTCNDAMTCGTEEYTAMATHLGNGRYSATVDPMFVGSYDVVVEMMNDFTTAASVTILA